MRLGCSAKQALIYAVIALGLSAVEVCNVFSMIVLPASWYALMKGSDVAFSLILSRMLLHKRFPWEQNVAAACLFLGVAVAVAFGVPITSSHEEAAQAASKRTHISRNTAAWLSLLAAFLGSLMTVVADGFLKKRLQDEESKNVASGHGDVTPISSELLLSNFYSMSTTAFSFLVLVLPFLISDESRLLSSGVLSTSSNECAAGTHRQSSDVGFWSLVVLIGLTRFLEKNCKYYMTLRESAFFFSVVQSARRLIGVFVLAGFLGEHLSEGTYLGAALSILGFALYLKGSVSKNKQKSSVAATGGELMVQADERDAMVER